MLQLYYERMMFDLSSFVCAFWSESAMASITIDMIFEITSCKSDALRKALKPVFSGMYR